jgi:hypothetical protein
MRSCILLFTCCCCSLFALARQTDSLLLRRKLSPHLLLVNSRTTDQQPATFWIVTNDLQHFKAFLATGQQPVKILSEYPASGLLVIQTTRQWMETRLLPDPRVLFADEPRTPREEQVINSFDATANQLNIAHRQYPAINGAGLVVSVKENKPDTTDIDFKGRFLPTPLSAASISSHAGIMSTMIGGAGNTDPTGQGAAWGVTLSSSDFASLLPDANSAYQQYHISVQNHSYGTGIENYYGADAAAYDASTIANNQLLHVFSAGNSGNQTSTTGAYTGIVNKANITGSFKMAKNIITVGATNSSYEIEQLSSRGPAYDGRLKPELVAFGEDGSSGAAAIVSGTALLVQQAYRDQHGQLPPAVLVKALLLNTADDVAEPGIDFRSGYGSVNGLKALQATQGSHYQLNSLAQGQEQNIPLTVPAGIRQVKITLCWYDPPAAPNAPKALINDLDLVLENNATGERWQPWVLNHFPHTDSLLQTATRRRDSLNNNEQITIDNPAPGSYTIRVLGHAVAAGTQAYAIAWQADTANRFQWYYPTRSDKVSGGNMNILRWNNTFSANNHGDIEFTTDGGAHWQYIGSFSSMLQGRLPWQAPDVYAITQLRCTIGNAVFLSDTFSISSRLRATTGFNCTDSFMLTWNKPAGIDSFVLYALGDQYLAPLRKTSDTTLVLPKRDHASLFYTVAPLLKDGITGISAFTFNYAVQGVGCYIKSFLADQGNDQTVTLQIELGTLYGIQQLTIEKLGATGYESVETITPVTQLQYIVTHKDLRRGANTYRLKIRRQDGTIVYSDPETIYFFGADQYIVYPNPVSRSGVLKVLSAVPERATITFFNTTGQQVLHKQLYRQPEEISLYPLGKGLYFYVISRDGKKEQAGSVMVY